MADAAPGLARLALALLDELGFDRVAVLGYSFGGMVAQQLARSAPERVDRLVLAATTCGMGAVPGRPEALAALWTPWRYYSASYFDLVAPTTFGGRARAGVESAQREVRLGRPPSMIGYGQQLFALAGWTSLPWLHQIASPTLVICGDDDPIVPVVNGRVLARRIPRRPPGGRSRRRPSAAARQRAGRRSLSSRSSWPPRPVTASPPLALAIVSRSLL